MKKALLIIPFSLIFFSLLGQDYISMSYNTTASGRNIALGYSKSIKSKNELGGSLRINISRIRQPDDEGNVFYKRLHATEFYQNFGLQLYYHRNVFENWTCIKPYLLYDFQITKSTTRDSWYFPVAYDTNGDLLYKNYIEYFGPFIWIEQSIGFGFKAKIFDSFYLFQNIGASIMFIVGKDERMPETYDKFDWEFGYLFTVGLAYKIKK